MNGTTMHRYTSPSCRASFSVRSMLCSSGTAAAIVAALPQASTPARSIAGLLLAVAAAYLLLRARRARRRARHLEELRARRLENAEASLKLLSAELEAIQAVCRIRGYVAADHSLVEWLHAELEPAPDSFYAPDRPAAADRAALDFLVGGAQALAILLARSIRSAKRIPKNKNACARVRDSLQGLLLCIDAMQGLLAAEDVGDSINTLDLFNARLADAWDRGDLSADVWATGSQLLSEQTRSGYVSFLEGDDEAFAARWQVRSTGKCQHAAVSEEPPSADSPLSPAIADKSTADPESARAEGLRQFPHQLREAQP